MVRRIFQDVVPPKRSIRDISLDETRALERKAIAEFRAAHNARISKSRPVRTSGGFSWFLPLLILVLVGAGVFFFFFSNPKAVVTYTPKTVVVPLAFDFLAANGTHALGLSYVPVSLAVTEEKEISTTNTAKLERRASGTIVIYNAYTAQTQRLIKNTRFESPDGKIFRIKDSVIIPGYTKNATGTVPGSAEAEVYAESPGEEYNIGRVDFTIPGFAGTPRAGKVYARAKTDILGGYIGTALSPTEAELKIASSALEGSTKNALLDTFEKQNPTLLLIPGAYSIKTTMFPVTPTKEVAKVQMTATLTGIAFPASELARSIADKALENFDDAPVELKNPQAIAFETKAPIENPGTQMAFRLSGDASLEWTVDTAELTSALAGFERALFVPTIAKATGIQSAEVSVTPFWATHFPSDKKAFEYIRR